MDNRRKNLIVTVTMAVLLLVLSGWCILKPADEFSESERRVLTQPPELTAENVMSTWYMTEFEEYALDQFPMREGFRKLKAFNEFNIFKKMDNNGIFFAEGHLSKIDYPLQQDMLDNAVEKFRYLYETYMKDKNNRIYFSVVPDKNEYLAEPNGYLSLDHQEVVRFLEEELDFADNIDLTGTLSLEDYYRTDTHWKQECLEDTAQALGEGMGADVHSDHDVNVWEEPFYGVYAGQYTLPVEPDSIKYLTSDTIDNCTVKIYDTGMPVESPVYNMEKAAGRDPYEMYLSGNTAVLTIENPDGPEGKELVMFRDSFGSSIAPLLIPGYSKITMIDIRYVQSAMVGQFVEFDSQDVLFLYNTALLNNSMAFK